MDKSVWNNPIGNLPANQNLGEVVDGKITRIVRIGSVAVGMSPLRRQSQVQVQPSAVAPEILAGLHEVDAKLSAAGYNRGKSALLSGLSKTLAGNMFMIPNLLALN